LLSCYKRTRRRCRHQCRSYCASRSTVEALTGMQRQLIRVLERDALLAARVERLASIPGVGRVVALTWALEMGDISSFTHPRATEGS